MNGSRWSAVAEFLRTDPQDVGCDRALELLHGYAELLAADAGGEARRRYPEVAAHLRACGPCATDLDGLLAAVAGLLHP